MQRREGRLYSDTTTLTTRSRPEPASSKIAWVCGYDRLGLRFIHVRVEAALSRRWRIDSGQTLRAGEVVSPLEVQKNIEHICIICLHAGNLARPEGGGRRGLCSGPGNCGWGQAHWARSSAEHSRTVSGEPCGDGAVGLITLIQDNQLSTAALARVWQSEHTPN